MRVRVHARAIIYARTILYTYAHLTLMRRKQVYKFAPDVNVQGVNLRQRTQEHIMGRKYPGNKIEVYTGYNDWTNTRYYRYFTICDELPEMGYDYGSFWEEDHRFVKEIKPAHIDCEQGSDEVYYYEYYIVTYDCTERDGTKYEDEEYIAIPLSDDYDSIT